MTSELTWETSEMDQGRSWFTETNCPTRRGGERTPRMQDVWRFTLETSLPGWFTPRRQRWDIQLSTSRLKAAT
jgi:hypothetical protein